MGLTVSITQPTYLPWLGYFDLISRADVFVLLDTVQFEKQSWQSRNRIRTKNGVVHWITVPIKHSSLDTVIRDTEIAPNPNTWRRKHASTIQQNLGRAPYYDELFEIFNPIIQDGKQTLLADLNFDFISAVAHGLKLDTQIVRSSELSISGDRIEFLLSICQYYGASCYYSNAGSSAYLEPERPRFSREGVNIMYQDWTHPQYSQVGDGFLSHLSCIDALACMGVSNLGTIIKKYARIKINA